MGGTKEKRRSRPQGCIAGLSLTELRCNHRKVLSFFRPLRLQERRTSQHKRYSGLLLQACRATSRGSWHPLRGTRPYVGRNPLIPQRREGLTILPPVSLRMAKATNPAAVATPGPALEPDEPSSKTSSGTRSASQPSNPLHYVDNVF
jgi:hypothetical protein